MCITTPRPEPPVVPPPRPDPILRRLKWILLAVVVGTFGVLAWGTAHTYREAPPLPSRFVTPDGATVFTRAQIVAGKAAFQRSDLMDFGSLYGNGADFGPDYTALLLQRLSQGVETRLALERYNTPPASLRPQERQALTGEMRRGLQHPISVSSDQIVVAAAAGEEMAKLSGETATWLVRPDPADGFSGVHLSTQAARHLGDFLVYAAWTTVAHRPGTPYSYTNNWPYDPAVGNVPTPDTYLWTWVSLAVLALGAGIVFYAYRMITDGSTGNPEVGETLLQQFPPLTPSQRKTGKYFISVAVMLFLQVLTGLAMAHDYAQRQSFYGLDILSLLPFNFLKAAHVQLAIIWIALAWIGSTLFLAPFVSGKEPRRQGLLVDILLVALWLVSLGTLAGLYAGIQGWLPGNSWFWFGNQGLEYLQLGRLYQLALLAAFATWTAALARALWPVLRQRRYWGSLEHLLLYSSAAVGVMYVFGLFPVTWIMVSFTLTDFWRWWVIHLWVEGAFEFFAAAVSAYLLVAMGLLSRRSSARVTYLVAIIVFLGGVIGIGHHYYWVGEPWNWLSLGSMFSILEILPLGLLVLSTLKERRAMHNSGFFPHRLGYLYLVGSVFWNFAGGAIMGGLINAPLVNYYEHGTYLTIAHSHTALFGAFGLLGLGLAYIALRHLVSTTATQSVESDAKDSPSIRCEANPNPKRNSTFEVGGRPWDDRLGTWAFWLFNAGLTLWILLNFIPVGHLQFMAVLQHGYAYARSLAFYQKTNLWQWLRLPGDLAFTAGAILLGWDFILKVRLAGAPPGPSAPRRDGGEPLRGQLEEIQEIQAEVLDNLDDLADRLPGPAGG